ncbi:hypothetical protein GCM10020216_058030 [Nonomuraea helvata]
MNIYGPTSRTAVPGTATTITSTSPSRAGRPGGPCWGVPTAMARHAPAAPRYAYDDSAATT